MGLFGKDTRKDPKEQVREWTRKLRTETRQLDRQIHGIQREEEKCKRQIKDAAKKGNLDAAKIMAKEMINSRRAITKLHTSKAQINSVVLSMEQQAATVRLAGSLQASTEVMRSMQSLVKIPEVAATMRELSKEMMKAGIIEEMMEETLEGLEPEGLEEDADAEVQVMRSMQSLVKIPEVAATMRELSKEMMKAGIIEEMMEETLEGLEPEGLEEDADAEVQVMRSMQSLVKIPEVAATMRELSKEMMKAGIIEEMMEETLEGLEPEGLEEDADAEVQVMRSMQSLVKIPEVAATMRELSKEMMKAGIIEEMMEETLEGLEPEGLEEDADAEVQVMRSMQSLVMIPEVAATMRELSKEMMKAGIIEEMMEETLEGLEPEGLEEDADAEVQVMRSMQSLVKIPEVAATMRELSKEMMKAGIIEEMMEETLEGLEPEGLEEDADAEVQVMRSMQSLVKIPEVAARMRELSKEMMEAGIIEEMMEETLEGLEPEGLEEDADAEVQVMRSMQSLVKIPEVAATMRELSKEMMKAGIIEEMMEETLEGLEPEGLEEDADDEVQVMRSMQSLVKIPEVAATMRELSKEMMKAGIIEEMMEETLEGLEPEGLEEDADAEVQVMRSMQSLVKIPEVAATMRELSKEMMKAGIIEEMMEETLEGLEPEGLEEDADAEVQVMRSMQSLVKIPEVAATMRELSKEMMKAGIIEEMMEETLEVLEPEGLEEDADAEVQVMRSMQSLVKIPEVAATMRELSKEMMKAGIIEEMMEETLEGLEPEGLEEDADAEVQVMRSMQSLVKIPEVAATMRELSKEMMKAGIIEEMMEETLEGLEPEGLEEDADAEVQVMRSMQSLVKIPEVAATMRELSKEMMKAGIIEEMMEETLEGLEPEGLEEDADAEVQVMRSMQSLVKIPEVAATMRELSKEMMKAGIIEEMMEETLEGLEPEGLEEDADAEVQVMRSMQSLVKIPEVAATMRELSKEMMKAGIIEEMMEETLEGLEPEGLEEGADAEVEKILFEVTKGELGKAPAAPEDSIRIDPVINPVEPEAEDMAARLEALRS